MANETLKLELVKVNFLILGAVLSAVNIGFRFYEPHIVIGTVLIAITALLQYLSLIPGFTMLTGREDPTTLEEREEVLDNGYILLGFTAYTFLIFGFSTPHVTYSSVFLILPFAFAILIFLIRVTVIRQHPDMELSTYGILVVFSILILIGLVSFFVIFNLSITS